MNRRHVVWVAVVVGSLLGSGPVPVAAEDELSEAFVKAAERIAPSVVAIRVTKKEQASPPGSQFFGPPELRRFFRQYRFRFPSSPSEEPEGEQGMQERRRSRRLDPFNRWPDGAEPVPVPRQGMGSGVILTQNGHIVTNGHVVKDAQRIEVLFLDGESAEAQLVGTDPKSDLAVIKVDTDRELTPARLASSDHLRVGQWVLAVGSPFGLTHSVSAGIISGLQRNVVRYQGEGVADLDEFRSRVASTKPDTEVELTVLRGDQEVTLKVTIGEQPEPATVTEASVSSDWGLQLQTLTEELAEQMDCQGLSGALVTDVHPGSPAAEAGLEPGDLIMEVSKKAVTSAEACAQTLAEAGDKALVRVKKASGESLYKTLTKR